MHQGINTAKLDGLRQSSNRESIRDEAILAHGKIYRLLNTVGVLLVLTVSPAQLDPLIYHLTYKLV